VTNGNPIGRGVVRLP